MKKITCILLSVFSSLYLFSQATITNDTSAANILKHYVSALAHDSMQGRATGTVGMIKAADFIANEMQLIGLKTIAGNIGFVQVFPIAINSNNGFGYNLIGVIEGDSLKNEVIIISAHYDHIGMETGKRKDSVYNGANDDASGVAAVLFLASELKKQNHQRTILFIAFSGEEQGLTGSAYLAAMVDAENIKAVFNFEMLGRGKNAFLTGSGFGTTQKLLNKELYRYNAKEYGKYFFKAEPLPNEKLLYSRSDNFPFAKRGIPAHTIMVTTDSDKHYHKLSDETETLDYFLVSRIVKAAYIAMLPIVNGASTPERINAK